MYVIIYLSLIKQEDVYELQLEFRQYLHGI